jgi:hypothetical protein
MLNFPTARPYRVHQINAMGGFRMADGVETGGFVNAAFLTGGGRLALS